jgi:hypothetical protein
MSAEMGAQGRGPVAREILIDQKAAEHEKENNSPLRKRT